MTVNYFSTEQSHHHEAEQQVDEEHHFDSSPEPNSDVPSHKPTLDAPPAIVNQDGPIKVDMFEQYVLAKNERVPNSFTEEYKVRGVAVMTPLARTLSDNIGLISGSKQQHSFF